MHYSLHFYNSEREKAGFYLECRRNTRGNPTFYYGVFIMQM